MSGEQMNGQVTPIWWRWLLVVSLIGALFGTLMVIAPGLLRPLSQTSYNSFFATDRYSELTAGEAAFQNWLYGVLGATMAGWCLTVAFVAYFPFRAGERWAWQALCLAVAVWFVLDTGTSWRHGVTVNVLFNTGLLIALGVPLVASRRFFTGSKGRD
jgi:hypothetical protein